MLNRLIGILGCLLVLSACKKELLPEWDKEENLMTDTTVFIMNSEYISHVGNQLTFQVDLVQLNHLVSEQNYVMYTYLPFEDNGDTLVLSDISIEAYTSIPAYTSVFLFETGQTREFNDAQWSFYLRRYFEQIEQNKETKKVALASYRDGEPESLEFHYENNDIFTSDAAYKTSSFHDFIPFDFNESGGFGTVQEFRAVMDKIMDSLILSPTAVGQKSITIFDEIENNGSGYYNDADIDSIVLRAQENDIQINVVNFMESAIYKHIATETGGFVYDFEEANRAYETDEVEAVPPSDMASFLANLDNVLLKEVTALRCNMLIKGSGDYFSHQNVMIRFVYRNRVFQINTYIP